jgi:hypothetical protein
MTNVAWMSLVIAAMCGCKSKSEGAEDGGPAAKWVLSAECYDPFLQITVDVPAEQKVRLFGKDAYRNNVGHAYYNASIAEIAGATSITVEVAGSARALAVPERPLFPYTFVSGAPADHWKGTGTVGDQHWNVTAEVGRGGVLRVPLPCGATSAKAIGGGPSGSFERLPHDRSQQNNPKRDDARIAHDPFFNAAFADRLLDRTALDGEEDLRFDLAIDGFGGPATMKLAGKLSISRAVGGYFVATLAAGDRIATAPAPGPKAPLLFVLNGYALPDLLHGSRVRDAAVVAAATTAAVDIEPCHYSAKIIHTGAVDRTRADTHIVLYAASTGAKLGETTIAGKPPACPKEITQVVARNDVSQDVTKVTGEPNLDAAEQWAARTAANPRVR